MQGLHQDSKDSISASKETWELLIENGAKIIKNEDGDYPHFVAAPRNGAHLMLCMIKQGKAATFKSQDQDGNTFLHKFALDYKNKEDGTTETTDLQFMHSFIKSFPNREFKLHVKNKNDKNFYDILLPKLNAEDKENMIALLKKKEYDPNESAENTRYYLFILTNDIMTKIFVSSVWSPRTGFMWYT